MKATPAKPAPSRTADAYLHRLGERVRTLRNQRGMTRKALAQHAKGAALDLVLLTQFLERLPPDMLVEARKLVTEHFSSPSEDRRRVALIGLRGGGKSTLGALLAERLNVPFIELDREIERRSGANLSEIFDMFGQETFRRAEREALDDMLRRHQHFVMTPSGSIVTEPGTLELLLASCFTVWVRAEPEEHMKRVMAQGDMRPMANNARAMEDLVSILKRPEPLYAKAEAVLATTGKTPEQNLAELLRVIAGPATSIARRSA